MQKEKRIKVKHSFARRITRRVMLTVLLIMVAVSYLIYAVAKEAIGYMAAEGFQNIMALTSEKVKSTLKTVEVAAINVKPEIYESIKHPDSVYTTLQHVVENNPTLVGVAMAFQPDYYPQKGHSYEPYVARRDGGVLEKMELASLGRDYHTSAWYMKAVSTKENGWTEPYYDKNGARMMLCSYTMPLFNDSKEVIGACCFDVSLEWLQKQLAEIDRKNNESMLGDMHGNESYSFIISNNGTYIIHPKIGNELVNNYIEQAKATSDSTDDRIGLSMINGESGMQKIRNKDGTSFVFYSPIEHKGWSMAIVVPKFSIYLMAYIMGAFTFLSTLLGLLALFFICRALVRRIARPLTQFASSANEISEGNLNVSLPRIHSHDELGLLHDSFYTMQASLKQQMDELKTVNEQKGRIEGELEVASNIQRSMLPKEFPPFPDRTDIDIFGLLNPAKAVGGDLYNFFIRDEKLFFCIGDVAGKGVPASLVMAVASSLFRTVSAHEANPERIMTHINNSMSEKNESNMFVTLFIGVLDLPKGLLRYCNAGHEAPLLIHTDVQLLPMVANIPVGAMAGWHYVGREVQLTKGDTIFLYTDGLTEAEDASQHFFGIERVLDIARQSSPESSSQQLLEIMKAEVQKFVNHAEQSDDLTMLAIKYKKEERAVLLSRTLTLVNDVNQVPLLEPFVSDVCAALGLDDSATMQMNLALEEAVANIINYAYPKGVEGNILIEAEANDVRLKFTITDHGRPFDPTAKEEADTTLTVEERPIGGLGIFLVRQLMDSINYERVDDKNVLTLRKKLLHTAHDISEQKS